MVKMEIDTIVMSARKDSEKERGGEVYLLENKGYGFQQMNDEKLEYLLERIRNKEPVWFTLHTSGKGIRWFGKVESILPERFAPKRSRGEDKRGEKHYFIKLDYISSLPNTIKSNSKRPFQNIGYTTFASILNAKDTSDLDIPDSSK